MSATVEETVISGKRAFPSWLLHEGDTALVLFAAAFGGVNDAQYLRDAGLTGTCVDIDHEKLGEMALQYPEGWEYVHADVFDYALWTQRTWDVVTVDPFTNLFGDCAVKLPIWCAVARKAVVLGCGRDQELNVPDGWTVAEMRRRSGFNGGVFWAVIVRG